MSPKHLPPSWAYEHTYRSHRERQFISICTVLLLLVVMAGCAGVTGTHDQSGGGAVQISISPTSETVQSSSTLQFSATVTNSSDTSVTWSTSAGTISTSGLFTAPSVTQTTNVTVTVTSVADPTKLASAAVTVTPPGSSPLTITTASLPSAITGTAYNASLSASGGTKPYSWSLASGQLPSGFNLSSAGVISGTTTQSGTFSFNVRVTDSASPANSVTTALKIVVNTSVSNGQALTFFGMHVNHASTPWPSVQVGSNRVWDADGAAWALINTAQGTYDWSALDTRLAQAKQAGADVLYDLGRTPVWAQCSASTSSPCNQSSGCAYSTDSWGGGAGQCYWPGDLNADGTGTNQHWKDWVTALATHSVNSTTAHIRYYEIWNEPNDTDFFRGTTAQLVRMTQDAACIIKGVGSGCTSKAIDPNAMIVSPPATYGGSSIDSWLSGFFAAGGDQYADVIAFHGYDGTAPEKIVDLVNTLQTGSLATYHQAAKPLFDTEFSWGMNNPISDPDQQAGFVARSLLLHWSASVDRIYWYSWDTSGTMWTPTSMAGCTTPDPSGNGFDCTTAQAYSAIEGWVLGTTLTQPCAATGTIWTCSITGPGGYQALAVWDTAQSCNSGVCTTSAFALPAGSNYVQYRTLTGQVKSISGSSVSVGYKPILLEN